MYPLFLQLPKFHGPSLPPKSVLKNTSQSFLEKRRKALDNYLQVSITFIFMGESEMVLRAIVGFY